MEISLTSFGSSGRMSLKVLGEATMTRLFTSGW